VKPRPHNTTQRSANSSSSARRRIGRTAHK
jgi:hypothetical protein